MSNLKIQRVPMYLVKRVVVEQKVNQFGELLGRKFTYQVVGLVDTDIEARELRKALQDADEFYEDDLPDNVEIYYEIEQNKSEVIEPITRFTNLELCSAYADEIEE